MGIGERRLPSPDPQPPAPIPPNLRYSVPRRDLMNRPAALAVSVAAAITLTVFSVEAQRPGAPADPDSDTSRPVNQTMKTLARGTEYAASSMAPQATLTAEHVLRSGGNAFDAIVAGQAVLGLMQPNANGVGSDAVLLIHDARAHKVWSLNAEGTAP